MDNVIESSTSNASVVHDVQSVQPRATPMNININTPRVKKFDWKVYKFTIKQLNINAEYKALRHFNKYARPGTQKYIKYLRNLYGIMSYFDEKTYMLYANLSENITLEQLYIYFRTTGYKEFPLNEKYDRLYYNIEEIFDTNSYYSRYSDKIDNYLYTDDNYDAGSDDWETGSQMSSLTTFSQASTSTTHTRGSMLSSFVDNANNHRHGRIISHEERTTQSNNDEYNRWKEQLYNWYEVPDTLNKKIYKFYQEHKDNYPLDNKYFLIKYNINNPLFDPSLYIKINKLSYNLNSSDDLDRIYTLFSKNQHLGDNYYKIYYDIPDDLNIDMFIKRYFEIFENKRDFLKIINQEQKNYVYMVFNKLKESSNFCYLDDIYFRLCHNIPNEFNFNNYITRYPEIINEINNKNLDDVNNNVKIKKEEKYVYENFNVYTAQYGLDDGYYKIFYNIPQEFDYNIFINVYPEIVSINNLQEESVIYKLSDYVKESVLFDNTIKIYKYYSENSKKYDFNDAYYDQYYIKKNDISEQFNIETYINMYEHLKININCIHFNKDENKREYYELYYKYLIDELKENPVDDKYYRLLYKIPSELDVDNYVKRYPDINDELIGLHENTLEYNKKLYQLLDLKNMPIDDKYYRLLYKIPSELDVDNYVKRYPDINNELIGLNENTLEYNKKLYQLLDLKSMPIDDKYYRLLYKIPDLLDPITYVKRYPDINNELIGLNENTLEYNEKLYQLLDLKSMSLDDKYYRLLYNIPDLLDPINYVKRYPDINDELAGLNENTLEYNIKIYNLCKTLLNYFKLDDKYYKIKYDISFLFQLQPIIQYKVKYNLENNNYENEYQWFYEEGKHKIDLLSDEYLNILFSVPADFNWKIYYFNNSSEINSKEVCEVIKNTIDENNINKLKSFCYFVTKNTNIIEFINNNKTINNNNNELLKSIDIERKTYYNISLDFDYLQYSDENAPFYMNTRINVTADFVYLFYTNKITLENLYNLYKNNIQHEHIIQIESITEKELEVEQQFIKNYEYLLSSIIKPHQYKEYFVLNNFIEEFYRNKRNNNHIKLNDTTEPDIINKIMYNKNEHIEYKKLFNHYKKLNYTNLLNKFKNKEVQVSNNITDLNIAYIYFAYDTSGFAVANFIYSLKYIPTNINIYIFTNNSMFDDICNCMSNIRTISVDKIENISTIPASLINDCINEQYIFIWNTNYIMINDHTFMKNEITNDIMVSNTNNKYINIGILRKKITNTFKNINNSQDLDTFRKHKKVNSIILVNE